LIRGLSATFAHGERAAILGRNGVGKSTLLSVFAGETAPERGQVWCHGSRHLVAQHLPQLAHDYALSPGQARRFALQRARELAPDLLLLDEPSQDLDADGITWLSRWLNDWKGALLVISHDPMLLRLFADCLVVSESGCQHKTGDFKALIAEIEREQAQRERAYLSKLHQHRESQQHQERVCSRRERKKNLGRLHELRRRSPRARLNEKRSYAQESQGKRSVVQDTRLEVARGAVKSARRVLTVELALEVMLGALPEYDAPAIRVSGIDVERQGRVLFEDLTLEIHRQRVAITGPNGAGKSTLVEILAGERKPRSGQVQCDARRIGYVAQGGKNWAHDDSVIDLLRQQSRFSSSDEIANVLRAHRFPLALAGRSLASLSAGERLRAALICLCHRVIPPDVLILDEPTQHLDFVGVSALRAALTSFQGGLVIVSHDAGLLEELRIEHQLSLRNRYDAGT
jgi:ATPase subunit of ABC transporter with duplicated ATPase domains